MKRKKKTQQQKLKGEKNNECYDLLKSICENFMAKEVTIFCVVSNGCMCGLGCASVALATQFSTNFK